MYVPLSKDFKEGDQIIFEYKKRFWPEKFSMIVSILVFLGLIYYILEGKIISSVLSKIGSKVAEPISETKRKSKKWWEEDDY